MKSRINSPVGLPRSEAGGDVADGVSWTVPSPVPPTPALSFPNATAAGDATWAAAQRADSYNATLETHDAMPLVSNSFGAILTTIPLNDNSVGIPANKMADCLLGVASMLDSTEGDNGLRTPIVLRFVGTEDALLSPSYHRPIMRMDLNDALLYHRE